MTNTKELLELAAKAVGYTIEENGTDINGEPWYWANELADNWMPHIDDGDCFRLAVYLGLFFPYMHDRFELFQKFYLEELDKGFAPTEATRLAVLRAAAKVALNT